jgi:hypothetical protein
MFPWHIHMLRERRLTKVSGMNSGESVATSAATAAAATTSAKATAAVRFGPRFVHVKCSAVEVPAVQTRDRAIRFRVGTHFDEAETARLAGIAIGNNVHAIHCAISLEQRAYRIFGSAKAQVAYKNILHSFSFKYRLL